MTSFPTRTVNVGILGSLLIVVGVGAVSVLGIRDLIDNAKQVTQTHLLIAKIEETLSVVKDVESGARGYALTGDEKHLDHYRQARQSIKERVGGLRVMVGNDPERNRDLDILVPLLDRELAIEAELIDRGKRGGTRAAAEFIRKDEGRLVMDQIRTAIGEMETGERDALEGQRGRLDSSAVYTTRVIVLGGLLTLALMAGAGIIIFRDTRRLQREKEALAERTRLAAFAAEIGASLSQGGTIKEMLQGSASAMVTYLEAALARIWTFDEREQMLILQAGAGLDASVDGPHRIVPIGSTEIGLIAQERQPHVTNDYLNDPRASDPAWARREGIVAFAGYPLIVGDRHIGMMAMFSRKPLGEFTLKALATAASSIAMGTERRWVEGALEESEFKVRAIFETSSDGIVSIDEAGTIEGVNPAALRMFGHEAWEMLGKDIGMLMPEPARSLHHEHVQRYIKTGQKTVPWARREISALRKDGSMIPVELSISEVRLGARRIFAGTFRDIEERKAAQAAVFRAKEVSETASRAKSEFLSNMSHELRTPLNSVIGFANILLKNKSGGLHAQDLQFLTRILENGKHLLKLINEVLDLSKIEAGRMDLVLSSVRLDTLIREVLGLMESQTRDRDVVLEAVIPAHVAPITSDADKLKQCLINLVGNALKFAEHGHVTVRLSVEEGTHRPVLLEVQDTGIGIPKDRQVAIFEAFHQADNTIARRHGGTGLGLTITRSFLHLLGHTIDVVSEPGKGSNFRVHLTSFRGVTRRFPPRTAPRPSGDAPRPREEGAPPEPARIPPGKRVLVIDDDGDSLLLITEYLREAGCEVLAAARGGEGLDVAREERPDLILLDLLMPGMDGWSVLRQLKADAALSAIPVAIVSVVATDRQGLADDVLKKPVTREAVRELLVRVFVSPRPMSPPPSALSSPAGAVQGTPPEPD